MITVRRKFYLVKLKVFFNAQYYFWYDLRKNSWFLISEARALTKLQGHLEGGGWDKGLGLPAPEMTGYERGKMMWGRKWVDSAGSGSAHKLDPFKIFREGMPQLGTTNWKVNAI